MGPDGLVAMLVDGWRLMVGRIEVTEVSESDSVEIVNG